MIYGQIYSGIEGASPGRFAALVTKHEVVTLGKHAQALGRAPVAAMSGFQIALVQDCPELVDSVEKVVFWFGALVFAVRFELENSARLRSCNVRRPRFPSCGCLVCLLIACRTTLGDAERAACNLSGPCIIPFHGYDRDIRPFCIGRFSWLFSDTVAGAKANPMVYSLMLTCRACNVEPYAYLVHVLTELPQRAPDADVTDLLPFNFAKLAAAARNPA